MPGAWSLGNSKEKPSECALSSELDFGEILVWCGRPLPITLAFRSFPTLFFALIWIGTVGSNLPAAISSEHAHVSLAIGLVMFGAGVWLLWHTSNSMLAAWHTYYGITDRRLIVMEQRRNRRITSWAPQQITSVQIVDRGSGRGDLVFHKSYASGGEGGSLIRGEFVDVPDAKLVAKYIFELVRR
jgi:hypothetical protein